MKMNMNSRGSISNKIAAGLQDLGSQPLLIGLASLAAHMTCEHRVREDYIHECKVSRSRILTGSPPFISFGPSKLRFLLVRAAIRAAASC